VDGIDDLHGSGGAMGMGDEFLCRGDDGEWILLQAAFPGMLEQLRDVLDADGDPDGDL
jgi:hypothetical protein